MSIFSRLYTGVLDTVYGFKLGRFRSHLEKQREQLQHLIVRKPQAGNVVDRAKIRDILIIKNESFADMMMVTPLIRNLAVNGYRVDVLASEANQMVLEHNPYVHEMIVQTGGTGGIQKFVQEQMKGRHYDMVLDLRNPVYDENLEWLLFPQHIACDYLVGWNRSNIGIYDESLEFYDESERFANVVAGFLSYLGIENADLSYDVTVADASRQSGLHYMRNLWRKGGPVVLLVPFSGRGSHSLSEYQINSLVDKILECYPFGQIVLAGLPAEVSQIKVNALQEGHVHKYSFASMMDAIPLFEYADIVVASDMPVMHLAAAFQKPLVAFSTSVDGVALGSKEKAQNEYEHQMQLLKADFLDAPKIQAGVRPAAYLVGEHVFMPVNDKSEQLFSNTMDMTYLSIDSVVDAFQRLAMQYVHDPQYVSPMKALFYVKLEEKIEPEEDGELGEVKTQAEAPNDEPETAVESIEKEEELKSEGLEESGQKK